MLRFRHKCRRQHARGKLQLTLRDNVALTLALAQDRSSSALLNTTGRELCVISILNDISVAVRWLPSEWNSSNRGTRMYDPPPRDFFCDARDVGAGALPLSARHERKPHGVQTAKRLRRKASALDHRLLSEITSPGTGALTKGRLVSDTRVILEF